MRYNVKCETCGKDCGKKQAFTKYGDFCSKQCREKSKKKTCEVCSVVFINRDRKTRTCTSPECRSVVLKMAFSNERRRKNTECEWCGKIHAVRKRPAKEHFCSRHCRDSKARLKAYVKNRLRLTKKECERKHRENVAKEITESWVQYKTDALEKKTHDISDEQKWYMKISSLCSCNRYREEQASVTMKADWTKKDRNKNIDWKYGGAWNRIIYLELRRLSNKVDTSEMNLWYQWVLNRVSSMRKRMRRKQAAGCLHGD